MSALPGYAIVFVDDHLVVVHKDAGLLTVPAPHDQRCLVDLLEAELDRERFGRHRLAVVHRLDRQTSGLLVLARTPKVAAMLAKQFSAHSVEREYVAIVMGVLAAESGTIRSRLDGKHAVTHYETRARQDDATSIAVRLETGRRNQIRLHFAAEGHPVVGDVRFGGEGARHGDWRHERVALHARVLGFTHPVGRSVVRFEDPVPAAFEEFEGRRPPRA